MQILHIDSSILGEASASRELSAAIVAEIRKHRADATVVVRDVSAEPIPHLDGVIAAGFRPIQGGSVNVNPIPEHSRSRLLAEEVLASDLIVMGAPMYNFSVPSQLKAWIDRVVQPGVTFRYTATGPEGLLENKSVIVASTRGGMYSAGAAALMDFQEAYLKAIFGFMGIKKVSFIRAENLSRGADPRAQSLQAAHTAIASVVQQALFN